MKPQVLIVFEPDPNTDYASIYVSIRATTDDGRQFYVRPYEQLRLYQPLSESMYIESWALATIAQHTDAIKAALAALIHQGTRTLMVDTSEVKRH